MDKKIIEHRGIVESIGNKNVSVRFTVLSACVGCQAKGYCSISEKEDRVMTINCDPAKFGVGDTVNIVLSHTQGVNALLIGYIYPFLLVVSGLIIFSILGIGELYAGLGSLLLLLPYYVIIRFFNKKINKNFQFTLHKIEAL